MTLGRGRTGRGWEGTGAGTCRSPEPAEGTGWPRLASRVRPEVEAGVGPPPRPPRAPHHSGGSGLGEGASGSQRQARLCLGTKGSPSHSDCAAVEKIGEGRTFQKEERRGNPRRPSHPLLEVGSVNGPDVRQRKGSPQRHSTALHPSKPCQSLLHRAAGEAAPPGLVRPGSLGPIRGSRRARGTVS